MISVTISRGRLRKFDTAKATVFKVTAIASAASLSTSLDKMHAKGWLSEISGGISVKNYLF